MKLIKITFIVLLCSFTSTAQITFKGCPDAVLGDQNYILTATGSIDNEGITRNTYESSPTDFAQSCPSGICEIRILWNISNSRWEIQLDNDGPLTTPDYTTATLYYNTENSYPNPPSLNLGTWVDTVNVDGANCGGNLTSANATLTGDVQDNVSLSIEDFTLNNLVSIFPNPAENSFKIKNSSSYEITSLLVSDLRGSILKNIKFQNLYTMKKLV